MSLARSNEKHYNWKGEKASYRSKHDWVRNKRGKAKKCVDCGVTRDKSMIHWSNIDHKYRRNLDDYVERCTPCHKKYDLLNGLCKH